MTVLASLNRAYGRMKDAPPFGYSTESISFVIALNDDGSPAGPPIDVREQSGKKRIGRAISVPQAVKRTSGVSANFLWDKTPYVLGVTAGPGRRTAEEHAAFVARQLAALAGADDPGLVAVRRFVETWTPEQFAALRWDEAIKDTNVVFALERDRLSRDHVHDRPAARALWAALGSSDGAPTAICLVTGDRGPIARLHPSIRGVWGGQTSGGSIVSFNLDAFKSYGHEQGDNAPVSEAATFAYTTALNRFLERDSGHRIQIGDASTVFWADASDAETAALAEASFGAFLGTTEINESIEAKKVQAVLDAVRQGRPAASAAPQLTDGVRFYVLGLSPNAARLSVRFWLEDDFREIADRFGKHFQALSIEPPPRDATPSMWRYLVEAATQGKSENIPPNLAGEWLRAILTGAPYPMTLLATVLMRLRADKEDRSYGIEKEAMALRVSMLKAVLVRNFDKEVPVARDTENADPGYLLGRLFATYELIQRRALGDKVNSTIRDKFYGSASATPRKVFSLLDKGSANHLSKIGKDRKGYAVNLEKQIAAIMQHFSPSADPFPSSLSPQQQVLFAVGYYHEKYHRKDDGKEDAAPEATSEGDAQ